MTQILVKTFDDLSKEELHDLLKLRADVFIYEQECVCIDIDGHDSQALHVVAFDDEVLVGTTRLRPQPEAQCIELGRIAVAEAWRGKGIGTQMLEVALETSQKSFPGWAISLSSQQHLETYYHQFGFVTVGEAFYFPKDKIPHVPMRREKP